jgi:protoporphyrinogen oxidase
MACSLDDLSLDTVKRFFPKPDEEMIEIGYIKEGSNLDTGYNNSFWYPKKQGIGLLAKGMARGLNALQTNCQIERIDLASRCAYTSLGRINYEKLLTSLPLKAFCKIASDLSLGAVANSLRHTRAFCLNLLIQGSIPEAFADCHWIYVPGKDIPFYRLGIYSNISKHMNPKGTTALYVEVAFEGDAILPAISELLNDIFPSLERLGWISTKNCLIASANWIDYAYVKFNHSRQKIVREILDILHNYQVYPIGRYGLWDYISMEDTILMSIETANMLVQ